jgi:hypothetical protein
MLKLTDPQLLASLLRDGIRSRGTSVNGAAHAVGMSQPTLHSFVHGKRSSVRTSTAEKLRFLVRRKHRALFDQLLYPLEAQVVLLCYQRWCLQRMKSWLSRRTPSYVAVADRPVSVSGDGPSSIDVRLRDWLGLVQRVRAEHFSHWAALERLLDQHECGEERRQLAYLRVLEPLLEARDSAFVERRWDELEFGEKTAFLNAGITRERILLNRRSDVERALTAVETPAERWRPPSVRAVLRRVPTTIPQWARSRRDLPSYRIDIVEEQPKQRRAATRAARKRNTL